MGLFRNMNRRDGSNQCTNRCFAMAKSLLKSVAVSIVMSQCVVVVEATTYNLESYGDLQGLFEAAPRDGTLITYEIDEFILEDGDSCLGGSGSRGEAIVPSNTNIKLICNMHGSDCHFSCSGGRHIKLQPNSTLELASNVGSNWGFSNAAYGAIKVGPTSKFVAEEINFWDNHAMGTNEGGAIYARPLSTIELTKSSFNNNTCYSGNGGAINLMSGCSLALEGKTYFTDNESDIGSGGAIYAAFGAAGGSITFSDEVTFESNVASEHGGAIAIEFDAADIVSEAAAGTSPISTEILDLARNNMVNFDSSNNAKNGSGDAIYIGWI